MPTSHLARVDVKNTDDLFTNIKVPTQRRREQERRTIERGVSNENTATGQKEWDQGKLVRAILCILFDSRLFYFSSDVRYSTIAIEPRTRRAITIAFHEVNRVVGTRRWSLRTVIRILAMILLLDALII